MRPARARPRLISAAHAVKRQLDNECAAPPGTCALRPDVSAVLLHELSDERQAKSQSTGSAPRFTDERFENALEHVGPNPHACVAHDDLRVVAGPLR